jgi:hypothetical protein
MNAGKHWLTVFHCAFALVATPLGFWWAGTICDTMPWQALLLAVGSVVLPVFIASRVSWRAGFEAGCRERPVIVATKREVTETTFRE